MITRFQSSVAQPMAQRASQSVTFGAKKVHDDGMESRYRPTVTTAIVGSVVTLGCMASPPLSNLGVTIPKGVGIRPLQLSQDFPIQPLRVLELPAGFVAERVNINPQDFRPTRFEAEVNKRAGEWSRGALPAIATALLVSRGFKQMGKKGDD
jgi:hypothetical protein